MASNGVIEVKNLEPEDVRADLFTSSTKRRVSRLNTLQDEVAKQGSYLRVGSWYTNIADQV
jgi:hypothetical protein